MNSAETRLIEEGWAALVERLGLVEATRFVMLIDRRTGGALQHLHYIRSGPPSHINQHNHQRDHAETAGTSSLAGSSDDHSGRRWHDHA
jgi:hypothetical protein